MKMPAFAQDPSLSMRAALAIYFAENGFGEDGGYSSPWVDFKIGPIPLPFPNTPGRVRAVRFHDMHHLVTGYRADIATGEFEISAWEIGAGCHDFWTAWQLNLGGMAGGLFSVPRKTFRAFVRGRRSSSLYGRAYEPLLDMTVGEVRALCGLDRPVEVRASDVALFALCAVAGVVIGLITLAMMLVGGPALLLWNLFRGAAGKGAGKGAPSGGQPRSAAA